MHFPFIKGASNHVDMANLYIHVHCLSTSDTVKDLRILIDDKLNFSQQTAAVVSKARKRVYLIFLNFYF